MNEKEIYIININIDEYISFQNYNNYVNYEFLLVFINTFAIIVAFCYLLHKYLSNNIIKQL